MIGRSPIDVVDEVAPQQLGRRDDENENAQPGKSCLWQTYYFDRANGCVRAKEVPRSSPTNTNEVNEESEVSEYRESETERQELDFEVQEQQYADASDLLGQDMTQMGDDDGKDQAFLDAVAEFGSAGEAENAEHGEPSQHMQRLGRACQAPRESGSRVSHGGQKFRQIRHDMANLSPYFGR